MATRREFTQWGMASTLVLTAAPTIAAAGTSRAARRSAAAFHTVLFDPRFEPSRRFAAEMQRLGAPVQACDANVTDLWNCELRPAWDAGAAAIAGMTVFAAYFAIEMMARDAGLRVAWRADHRRVDNQMAHRFAAGRGTLLHAGRLLTARGDWPAAMARLVMTVPPRIGPLLQREFPTPRTAAFTAPETLVSFVLARGDRSGRRTA
jgi:hypothetical protein